MDKTESNKPEREGSSILVWIDRWMMTVVSGLVVVVWIIADATGLVLSEGTKAALGAFVAYTFLKAKSDQRWRDLEVDKNQLDEVRQVAETVRQLPPGSPESLRASQEMVAVALEEPKPDPKKKPRQKKGAKTP